MVNKGTAYLLWLFFPFGIFGIHRFYLGKPVSGCFYLLTFGFFGIGQFLDLFLIPGMVEDKNLKYKLLHGSNHPLVQPVMVRDAVPSHLQTQTRPPLDVQILKVCRDRQGATLSDCIIATEVSPKEVKAKVQELCSAELLVVDNRETDGAVIYKAI